MRHLRVGDQSKKPHPEVPTEWTSKGGAFYSQILLPKCACIFSMQGLAVFGE
jgi:hypothetical protein